jgi:iron complex transport system permease protein
VVAAILSLIVGKVWVPIAVWHSDDPRWLIIAELRGPFTILAVVTGAGLGISGAAMQGFLRNPLASPSLFGVSSGAARGAVLSLYFGFAASALLLPACALCGAALSMGLLALLAG